MKLYQRFPEYIYRNLQYINDFSNISIVTQKISTTRQDISIYRQKRQSSYLQFHNIRAVVPNYLWNNFPFVSLFKF
ncbi:hypothetical protein CQZ94_17455 [Bacillus sp. MYb209]|nr:hypothetical protein CQZ94_17455 [Bacillus sp. MYb209]